MSTSRNEPSTATSSPFPRSPRGNVGQAHRKQVDQFTYRRYQHDGKQENEDRIDHAFKIFRYIQASCITPGDQVRLRRVVQTDHVADHDDRRRFYTGLPGQVADSG